MKAVYSHGCGQIATVRAIEFTFGEQATGSSWREGQCCIIVAGVIIVIVVIVAGVHRRCHRHRCHCRRCAPPVSSSSSMARRPVSSKRIGREGVTDHQSIWIMARRPISAKVARHRRPPYHIVRITMAHRPICDTSRSMIIWH